MNKTFHSIWNESKQAYVAAAETVAAKGKPASGIQVAAVVAGLMGSLLGTVANAQTAPPPNTLPTGGQVSAGQASISQSGANMVIQQGSDRAAINWQTFNVGKDAQVQFQQPSASSVTLNRVMTSDPSQIFGRITANGQVILTNPSGVYFGKDARLDVGGLVATTHGMSDTDFMAGKTRFERNGGTGSVVNEGELKAALGGYIALLAPEVRNQGAIIAHMGTVALASGETIDLKFDSNNRLTSLRVEPSQIAALVDNRHAVQAPGGLVIISAQSMDRLVGGVVKNSGAIEATGLQNNGGRILLSARTKVDNSGTLNASSATGQGGSVSLQGEHIHLQGSSRIDASGATGGGTVLVGGNWQGSTDPLLQATGQSTQAATTVAMDAGASIDASATVKGDGGKVVLWSDVQKPDGVTTAQGSVRAQGGSLGGNGGQVETSGHSIDIDNFQVDTRAASPALGQTGLWLIDPFNYTIGSTQASAISSALGTSNVEVTTATSTTSYGLSGVSGIGDITVSSNINALAAVGKLTLTADSDIKLGASISAGGGIVLNAKGSIDTTATTTSLNTNNNAVVINADSNANGTGTLYLGGLTVNPGSGDVVIRGDAIIAETARINGSGTLTVESNGNSFSSNVATSWLTPAATLTGLSIGKSTNAFDVYVNSNVSIAGPITLQGSGIFVQQNLASTGPGDLLFQGNSNTLSFLLSDGKSITKTAGDNTLTIQGNGRIDNGTGTIQALGSAKLNVVMIAEMDGGTSNGVVTGNISTNGGHVWMGGGTKTRTWNGLAVGAGAAYGGGGGNANGIDVSGNITTNGGDALLAGWTNASLASYADIAATGANRTINTGTGSITLLTRNSDYTYSTTKLLLSTTGKLTLAPLSGQDYNSFGTFNWDGTFSGNTFTAGGDAAGLVISNFSSLGGLTLGTYTGTGRVGDSAYTAGNTKLITIDSAIGIAGPISLYGDDVTLNANLTTTNATTGDVWIDTTGLSGTGNIALASGRSLTVDQSGDSSYLGSISGSSATLTKSGAGGLALLTASTYDGGTTVSGGILGLYQNSAAGTGAISLGANTTLRLGRAVTEIANNIGLAGAATVDFDTNVDYLIVGGGGGGGSRFGGGGGGGGVVENSASVATGNLSLSVGAGGAGGPAGAAGSAGAASSLTIGGATVTATGGLGGGRSGDGGNSGAPQNNAGSGNFWAGTDYYYGGGGGGAGSAATVRYNAGGGLVSWVTGTAYGGGGAGGAVLGSAQNYGTPPGGGADGVSGNRVGNAGVDGLGGGGGGGGITGPGGSDRAGGAGGSGTVVIRYKGSAPTTATGGTISYGTVANSGYTFQTFTTPGSDTVAFNTVAKLSGTISGASNLTVNATGGEIKLTGSNTQSGTTTLSGGTVRVGDASTTGTLGTGAVVNNATLILDRRNDFTVGNAISGTGTLTKVQANVATLTGNNSYTGTTTISAGTLQVGDGGTSGSLGTGAVVDNAALVFNRSDSLSQAGLISGTGTLTQQGSGTLMLTANNTYTGTNTIANGVLVLSNDSPNPTNKTFGGTGKLRIEPVSNSFTSGFLTSSWTFGSSLSGLTLGKDGNTANITIDSATSIAGPITLYGGDIAINAALTSTGTASNASITLKGSGNVTDGTNGYVKSGSDGSGSLQLLGGNVTLDNSTNNDVGTLAASGVSGLTYLDKTGLTIGTVNGTDGVSATGDVNIGTQQGSLTIAKGVATTSTSSTALTLNASIASAIGADTDANLLVSGTPLITVGTGGVARLFTGGIAASSAVASLTGLGAGSGRFRYNADESTVLTSPNWKALSAGLNLIYREQPTATVAVADKSMTYGDTLPVLTATSTGLLNGDAMTLIVLNRLNSSSGNIRAGSYELDSDLTKLGYRLDPTSTRGTLSVAQKALSLTGLVANNKTYNRTTTATVSNYGSLSGVLSGDAVSVDTSNASAFFDNLNAGANKTVTVTGLSLAGTTTPLADDSANYTVGNQTTTATINKAALTISGITASNKTYDNLTSATVSTTGLALDGLVLGDENDVKVTNASGVFDDKNAGIGKRVTLSYTKVGSALANYTVTDQASTTADVAKATLTLSGASGVSKTYDGSASTANLLLDGTSTPAAAMGNLGGVLGSDNVSVSGAAVFASANVALDGNGDVTTQAIQRGTVGLSGTDAGNYSLSWTNGSGKIKQATLTVHANNETKFVTRADPTFTARYSGFVNGETEATAGLTGTLEVTRSNSGPDHDPTNLKNLVGTYTNAITASGLSANNYSIRYTPGNFTIVGAGQLLVRAAGTSDYGTSATYSITSVSYWDLTANSGAGGEVVLTGVTANSNNQFTINDGVGGKATFTLVALNPQTSTSARLRAGTYQLGASGTVTENSNNFSNMIVVTGTHLVNQAALTPVVSAAAKSKTYDGSNAMFGLRLSSMNILGNDVVSVSGSGFFSDKNVSRDGVTGALVANKSYTVSALSLSGADAANYYLPNNSITGTDGQISPRTLAVAYTGVDKVYNGLSTATVNTTDNRIAGDDLSIARMANFVNGSGTADKNVAYSGSTVIAKNISITGASLSGSDAGNYDLASATGATTAKITPAALVISGIVGLDKTYDKTTDAPLSVTGLSKNGLVLGDDVAVAATGTFADDNAGLGKAVTIASIYTGADVSNYTIIDQATTTASINKRLVSVLAGGVSKVYDGTTDMNGVRITLASVNGVSASGVLSGDTVDVSGTGSFSSANVSRDANGTVLANKSYTLADLQLSGASTNNYMIVGGATSITGTDGRIDPKTLTLTGFAAENKIYNGNNVATIANAGTLIGVVGTDAVTASNTGATFSDQNVAIGKTVTLNGVALAGNEAGNYGIASTSATSTADITAKTLTITGLVANGKTYDGTLGANISNWGSVSTGISGETLTLNHGTASFDNANAGTGKTVTASGYSLGNDTGGLASNYQLAANSATTTADVGKAALSITTSNVTKTYDGGLSAIGTATVSSGTLFANASNGNIQDSLSGGTFAFTDKNAGTGNKSVTVAGVTVNDGHSGGNYDVTYVTNTTSTITPKALTISGIAAADKVYDGGSVATVSTTGVNATVLQTGGMIAGDDVTVTASGQFRNASNTANDKNAGNGKTVALTSSYGGADAANYTITDQATTTASITPKAVILTPAAVTKVYDGQTAYTASANDLQTLSNQLLVGDTVTNAVLDFDNKDVGTSKVAKLTQASIADGNNGRNYAFTLGVNNNSSITTKGSNGTDTGSGSGSGSGSSSSASSELASSLPKSPLPGTGASALSERPQLFALSSGALGGSSGSTTQVEASSAGVTVDLQNAGQQNRPLMVAVSLPKGASTVGTGFNFELPEFVKSMATKDTDVQVFLANGDPLPTWLRFIPRLMSFEASAVPDRALPMQLQVVIAGQRVAIVISERTE